MYEDAIREFLDRLNERIEEENEDFEGKPARRRSKELYLDMGRLFGLEEARDILEGILKDHNLDVEAPEVWE